MTDPRIIPDEQLAEWEEDVRQGRGHGLRGSNRRIRRLIEHGKALAEQVDTLTSERAASRGLAARYGRRHTALVARTEKAEAERDDEYARRVDWQRTSEQYAARLTKAEARADAAGQRLSDRDKAIRDLADEWESGNGGMWHTVRSQFAAALRALLPEE